MIQNYSVTGACFLLLAFLPLERVLHSCGVGYMASKEDDKVWECTTIVSHTSHINLIFDSSTRYYYVAIVPVDEMCIHFYAYDRRPFPYISGLGGTKYEL